MLEQFSLPDVTRVARRTVLGALAVAVVALVVSLAVNAPLVGVGACVGLGMGTFNFRMITAAVIRVGKRLDANKRRPLAMNTLSRLAVISVVSLGLLFVSFQLGFGVLGGLAAFQVLLLANVARSMYVAGRRSAASLEASASKDPGRPGGSAVDVGAGRGRDGRA